MYDKAGASLPVGIIFLHACLHRIFHGGHIAQVNGPPLVVTHNNVVEVAAVFEFSFQTQHIGLCADVKIARGHIHIFGGNHLGYLL